MRVQDIAPGLRLWSGSHPEWTPAEAGPDGWDADVWCVYYEAPDAVVLIDPLVPPEDEDRFWRDLDHDVARAAGPVHALLTAFFHRRSAAAIAARYRAEIWTHEEVLSLEPDHRKVEPTRTFRGGQALPGGVEARDSVPFEAIFWIPAHRSLVFPDVVQGDRAGGARMCPESWLAVGDRGGHRELAEALRPLLELPVERLLVSHGEPVLDGGREALERALGSY